MRKFKESRRPSLWLAIPVVLVVLTVWTNTDFPLDYWLHVNNGRWMVEHGQWITSDTFSHTIDGQPVKNQPWLAQLLMFALHAVGGYALNQFVAGLCYATAVVAVMTMAARRCGNWTLAALAGVVSFAVLATNLGVRPQYLSVLLFVGQLWLLSYGRGSGVAWGCFVTAAMWTNIHGAFPLGVVLPALSCVAAVFDSAHGSRAERLRQLLVALVAAASGCFVRPFPADTIVYVCNVGTSSVRRGLEEWLPTSLATPAGPAFFGSALLVLVILAAARRRASKWEQLLLAAFFLLAATSQRMVIWWALALPIAMARPADHVWRHLVRRRSQNLWWHALSHGWHALSLRRAWFAQSFTRRAFRGLGRASPARVTSKPRLVKAPAESRWWHDGRPAVGQTAADRWFGRALAAFGLGFLLFCTPWTRSSNSWLPPIKRCVVPHDEPKSLVQHLVNTHQRPVRTFAPLPWGSYVSWYSDGQLKSFLDSRVDFFPDPVWGAFVEIRDGGPLATRLLEAYQVDLVVCGPQEAGLDRLLSNRPDWQRSYADDCGCVYERRLPRVRGSDLTTKRPGHEPGNQPTDD